MRLFEQVRHVLRLEETKGNRVLNSLAYRRGPVLLAPDKQSAKDKSSLKARRQTREPEQTGQAQGKHQK